MAKLTSVTNANNYNKRNMDNKLKFPYKQKIPKPQYFQGLETILREATTRFELVIRVLQTHALPLGYVAVFNCGTVYLL